MTRFLDQTPMRALLSSLLLAAVAAAADPLPAGLAAAHPEGKWEIRMSDFHRYLARHYGRSPDALVILPDYMKRRLIEAEARRRGIVATDADVKRWMRDLDRRIRKATGGRQGLEDMREEEGMTEPELRRRARSAILRDRLARAIYRESDPSRDADAPLTEDMIIVAMSQLYDRAEKETDPEKLPEGVVARVGGVEITAAQFGRELSFALPQKDVLDALRWLILAEEADLLVGNDDPPPPEDMAFQQRWFVRYQQNRLKAAARGDVREISEDMVWQVLEKRGFTKELVFSNPGFVAQAKARGHFRRSLTEEDLKRFYEENRARYRDKIWIARILVSARGQKHVKQAGRKLRSLRQGKARAEALWIRVTGGQDFGDVARDESDDVKEVRDRGGEIPLWIGGDNPAFRYTYEVAKDLAVGEISKPFFSDRAGGYLIVKLLKRKEMPGFEELKERIRIEAAERLYGIWRARVTRAALKSPRLVAR